MTNLDKRLDDIQQQMLSTLHVGPINGDTVDSVVWLSALEQQRKDIKQLMADEFIDMIGDDEKPLADSNNEMVYIGAVNNLREELRAKVKDWRKE